MTVPTVRGSRRSAAPATTPAVPTTRRSPEEVPPATTSLSSGDRAILMAVAAGRCTMSPDQGDGLLVDGRPCTDRFAGHRLLRAGLARLVAQPPGRPCTVTLSPAGVALLGLPITL